MTPRRRLALRRGKTPALTFGVMLGGFYLLMLALTTGLGSPPRPIYDGICPNGCGPTVCPPGQNCQPSYAPYSPPPPPPRSTPTPAGGPPTARPGPTQAGGATSTPGNQPGPTQSAGGAPSSAPSGGGGATSAGDSSVIGPSGGRADSADGRVHLLVPAGALAGATSFALVPLKVGPLVPPGMALTGPVYDFAARDANGPVTVFRKPITVQLTYSSRRPDFIFYWDGQAWLQTSTEFDDGNHLASTRSPHLTPFAGLVRVAATSAPVSNGLLGPLVVGGLVLVVGAVVASAVAVRRLAPAPAAGPQADPGSTPPGPPAAPQPTAPPAEPSPAPNIKDAAPAKAPRAPRRPAASAKSKKPPGSGKPAPKTTPGARPKPPAADAPRPRRPKPE